MPESLRAHPTLRQWLEPGVDGRVRAFTGKVDIGQGISHALRLIVAEELRLPLDRVEMVPVSTRHSPDEAVTSGSLSVQHSGAALRAAAAHLREACRAAMAQRHGVPVQQVACQGGLLAVRGQDLQATYAELVSPALLEGTIDPAHVHAAEAAHDATDVRAPAAGRPDVAAKVFGEFEYIQDRVLPGMCHGLVLRPGTCSAEAIEDELQALQREIAAWPGVLHVQRDGLLLGVLADTERVLTQIASRFEQGLAQGRYWRGQAEVPDPQHLAGWLQAQALETTVVVDRSPSDGPAPAVQRVQAQYLRPFLQHASVGLCCALAQWHPDGSQLEVWSHSQGIYNLRRDLALAFGLEPGQVQVTHAEGAGCYGHNGADDVAWDAAWLARLQPGRPVRVQWTRQAELGHAPLAPAMLVGIDAGLDAQGQIVEWTQTVWSQGHGTRPGRGQTPALLGAWQTAHPQPVTMAVNAAMAVGGGSERNAEPPYEIAALRVLNHRVMHMPQRVSAMRALGAPANVFAAESMMDELAGLQGVDALAFRLSHLRGPQHERAAAVLRRVAEMAHWPAGRPADRPEGWGRGLAYARYKNTGAYCAVAVELVAEERIRLRRLWIAADLGRVVDPDGAINQLEGGALQAASWALCESAQLGPGGVVSNDWTRYPILSFGDMPAVEVALMARPDAPSLGAGECSAGPTCAAIANAIHDALGVRLRAMPFTPEQVLRAVEAGPAPVSLSNP
jgi:nicotinate dehydrogenase subunit B